MESLAFRMGETQRSAAAGLAALHGGLSAWLDLVQRGVALTPALGGIVLGQQALTFAERNLAATLDFAQGVSQAADTGELVALHATFVRAQTHTLLEQAGALGQTAVGQMADIARLAFPPLIG